MRNLREEAANICLNWLGGKYVPHYFKVVEASAKGATLPAWNVLIKVPGTTRGRCIATLIHFPEEKF